MSKNVTERKCSIPGCDGERWSRGWCRRHYQRWRYHGSPTGGRDAVRAPGITSVELIKLTGASYRQLDYWVRIGRIAPTIPVAGSGSSRGFDPSVVNQVKALLALSEVEIPAGPGPWTVVVGDVTFNIEVGREGDR